MDFAQKILFVFSVSVLGTLVYFGGCQKPREAKSHEIQQHGVKKYRVGTSADLYPFEFRDKEGNMVGFDIDFIEAIAREAQVSFEIRDMPFDLLIPEMQVNNIDIIAASLTPTAKKAEQMHFTTSYLDADPYVIVSQAENPITTIEQFAHKIVAVAEGYTADSYVSCMKNVQALRLPTVADTVLAVENGRADALVTASNAVAQLKGKRELVVTEIPGKFEDTALGISFSQPELYELVNKAVIKLKQNGFIAELKKKWGIK